MHNLKTHHWFWMSLIPIALLWLYFFINSELVLDINIHDTYFVTSYADVFLLIATYFFIIGNIYFLYHNWSIPLIRLFNSVHKYVSITSLIALVFIKLYYVNFAKQDFPLFDDSTFEVTYVTIVFGVFFISQFLFFINIIIGTFKHAIQRTTRKQN